LYEGTRVTQNVKKSRAASPTGHPFAVLLLLGFGALVGALGCSKTKTPDGSMAEAGAGSGGCTSSDCNATAGRFTPCEASSECDEAHGFSCVAGECSYECRSHTDCVEVGHCEPVTLDGEQKNFCVRDATPPAPGKLYTACPQGDECADPALCIGAGAGDLDAYCTVDCTSDDDCATGYLCGTLSRNPCAAACDEEGQPSDPRCVPLDQIGKDGPFHCGDQGVERSVCRQREFCASCTSDVDCLGVPNQICAKDESGEKICTRLCDTEIRSCPWGNAGGCGYFDEALGVATCSHRFGSCRGTGKTCEPCRNNDDCPGGACISSSFTGEHWCVDLTISCECPNGVDASGVCANGGCPPSPSGLAIQCIGERNICYAANSGTQTQLGSSPQTGCWAAAE
jgi:hypothetical protein